MSGSLLKGAPIACLFLFLAAASIVFIGCSSDLLTAPQTTDDEHAVSAPFTLDSAAFGTAVADSTGGGGTDPGEGDKRDKHPDGNVTWGQLKVKYIDNSSDSNDDDHTHDE